MRFLLLLLRLLAPVTGFSLVLGGGGGSSSSSESSSESGERFWGGFESEAGFFSLSPLFWPNEEGLAEIEVRFLHTNIGAEALCLESKEDSGLVCDDGGGGGSEWSVLWARGGSG